MSRNRIAAAIAAGEHPIQASVSTPSPLIAEMVAISGYDGVWLDLQHGPLAPSDVYPLISTLLLRDVTVTVRVPTNDRGVIGRVLDAGARVVICPDVQSATEARTFADACHYPPAGTRGFGPSRASLGLMRDPAGGVAPFSTTGDNDDVMPVVQIESPAGLHQAEEIIGTDGVAGVFPGMVDYQLQAAGYVLPGLSFLDGSVRNELTRIVEVAHSAGKSVGLPAASAAEIPALLDLGADWLLFGGDLGWVRNGARDTIEGARRAVAEWSAAR